MAKDLSEFIITQLQAQGVRIRPGGSANIMAYCFGGHDHKSASLSIRRLDGKFQCFGCGAKGHNWNAIKNYLPGVEILDEQDLPDASTIIASKIRGNLRKAVLTMSIPWDVEPWEGSYRHVPQYTLDAIDACKWFDGTSRCYRILLPVTIEGELQGWTARRLDDKKDYKYLNSTDFPAKAALFPFDLVAQIGLDTVVLVEGPYDALRLVNMNIPALAIFGTKNYAPAKKGLLARLGTRKVILALDNDEGGMGARLDIARDLSTLFEVRHFHPPVGKDPGNMPMAAVEYLDAIVRELAKTAFQEPTCPY